MSIELIAAGSAIFVSFAGGIFNYIKLKDDQKISINKKNLSSIADLILEQLYGEAGLFMSYETRSIVLKTYR